MYNYARIGWENTLGVSPYNEWFRVMRKNVTRAIGSKALVARLQDLQMAEIGHFLLHILEDPEDLLSHIRR